MLKKVLLASILAALIVNIGCSSLDKPKIPTALSRKSDSVLYKLESFKTDYEKYKTAYEGNQLDQARRLRDALINRIRVDIELNYREYESKLFLNRAGTNLGADFLELGIAFATTVSNGERVKTVLGSVLTGFKGTRLSYDKNFFRERTIEIIITQMQAYRENTKNRILKKMSELSAEKYSFEEAWVDLTEFFYAGTLQGGLQSLANEAGKDAAKAKEETEQLELVRIATTDEVAELGKIRNSFNILFNQWKNEKPKSEAAKPFVEKAKTALKELNVKFKETDSDEAIFTLLNEQIRKSIKDRSLLEKLNSAFLKAEIIKEE